MAVLDDARDSIRHDAEVSRLSALLGRGYTFLKEALLSFTETGPAGRKSDTGTENGISFQCKTTCADS